MRLTKEELIEKYRDANTEYNWWENTYECFKEALENEGIEVEETSFDGFYHQRSYADFSCKVIDVSRFMEKNSMVEAYPMTYKLAGFGGVSISKSGRDRHRNTYLFVDITEWQDCFPDKDMDEDMRAYYIDLYQAHTNIEFGSFEQSVEDALKEHSSNLYIALQDEYEYLSSDEAVWETIRSNEWDREKA